MSSPLFASDDGRYIPSEHTRGPWSPAAQHAGPPAALLARAMEALPADEPMLVAHFSLDILRPIPLRPLRVRADVRRPGRRVQLLRAVLSDDDGVELCTATAWRLRLGALGLTEGADGARPFPSPDASTPHAPESDAPAFHRTGVELRFARGVFEETGPATVWIRLLHAVVDDEDPSPLQRAVAAADFGNGVSSALEWGKFLFINTDLAVYLLRPPRGEWVCLDARTDVEGSGIGVTESVLYDETGRIGRSLQTLLVDRLEGTG